MPRLTGVGLGGVTAGRTGRQVSSGKQRRAVLFAGSTGRCVTAPGHWSACVLRASRKRSKSWGRS